MTPPPRILYCNCTYAQVVPKDVKQAVLKKLCESGVAFDAKGGTLVMTSIEPNRFLWEDALSSSVLFLDARTGKKLHAKHSSYYPILTSGRNKVLNMRVQNADDVCAALFKPELKPNLPTGKSTEPTAAELPKSEVAA